MTGADTPGLPLPGHGTQGAAYALLDDRSAGSGVRSRLYLDGVRTHTCADPATLDDVWAAVEADQRQGLHAVVLADYEWGARLLGAGTRHLNAAHAGTLRVLMFAQCHRIGAAAADDWLRRLEGDDVPGPAACERLVPRVDRPAFEQAIARIHEAIRAGETYQVNYTYRMQGDLLGNPVALYRRLRARQVVAYGALIALPAQAQRPASHVLSLSPELFLSGTAGRLTARPMKGTAARRQVAEGDSETARLLSLDVKNRAENLMIVDLLRNDLGRIAEVGSVRVPRLFEIEPYTTVFQMTSTVEATMRRGLRMPDILRAAFPCGSITGAPKHHTMDLIAELENSPRGLYCGAIGWVDAPGGPAAEMPADRAPDLLDVSGAASQEPGRAASAGDFCFSVGIRTLALDELSPGRHRLTMGVGAGIVLDSVAGDEYDECRLKARFLTAMDPGFQLFETMRVEPETGVLRLDRHLARLEASATALGFSFDIDAARALIDEELQRLLPLSSMRLRLALSHDGQMALTHRPLAVLGCLRQDDGRVSLLLSSRRLHDDMPWSAHKTTARDLYDEGIAEAEACGAFDTLFLNTRGQLVEGGRCNVFVKLDGQWYTPPVSDGALPGVMRGVLLEDPVWQASERSIDEADLKRASALVVTNALRGALPARLTPGAGLPQGASPCTTHA